MLQFGLASLGDFGQLRYGGHGESLFVDSNTFLNKVLCDVGFVPLADYGTETVIRPGEMGMLRGRPVIVDEGSPRLTWCEDPGEMDLLNTLGAAFVIGIGAILLWRLFSFFGWM